MKENTLKTIHQELGEETHKIIEGKYNIYYATDEEEYDEEEEIPDIWEFIISFKTSERLEGKGELGNFKARPNFEAVILLNAQNNSLEIGNTYLQKEGYDHDRDENISNFYFIRHNNIENLELSVLEKSTDDILVKIMAETIVTGSNGLEPDAKLEALVRLKVDKTFQRTFS